MAILTRAEFLAECDKMLWQFNREARAYEERERFKDRLLTDPGASPHDKHNIRRERGMPLCEKPRELKQPLRQIVRCRVCGEPGCPDHGL